MSRCVMRLAELSARSDVPATTIKYYLRLGLLHSGERQSSTWSAYEDSHLRRLTLIRALIEVAGLPLAAVRRILEVVNDESVPRHQALGTAQWLLSPNIAEQPSAVGDNNHQVVPSLEDFRPIFRVAPAGGEHPGVCASQHRRSSVNIAPPAHVPVVRFTERSNTASARLRT
jgi:DNA-binding transcriptional MerR regulator